MWRTRSRREGDSNPRDPMEFDGRNSSGVWRTIQLEKKHLCCRDSFAEGSALSLIAVVHFRSRGMIAEFWWAANIRGAIGVRISLSRAGQSAIQRGATLILNAFRAAKVRF
jgi:hypothetical protein